MELPELSLPLIQSFLICLVRVGSLIATLPVFSGGQVPIPLRVGLVFLFSLVVYPVASPHIPDLSFSVVELGILVVQEMILGLMVGFLGQLIFMAAEFAGSVIGYQMGFAAANVFDPVSQRQVALISQFQGTFAILLFLTLDVHHLFLKAIVFSFEMIPPGSLVLRGAVPMLVEVTNHSLILSIKLVAPVLVLLIMSNLTLGIMSRIFPQLNVFFLSFPLNIGLSFVVMGLILGVVAKMLSHEFSLLPERFLQIFNLL